MREEPFLILDLQSKMANILIVEDEAIVALATKMMLNNLSHAPVAIVSSGTAALTALNEHQIDLVILDIKLKGDVSGLEVARKIRENKKTPILFITGNSDLKTQEETVSFGNSAILRKPILVEELQSSIDELLRN